MPLLIGDDPVPERLPFRVHCVRSRWRQRADGRTTDARTVVSSAGPALVWKRRTTRWRPRCITPGSDSTATGSARPGRSAPKSRCGLTAGTRPLDRP
jgi:hypothetical protein